MRGSGRRRASSSAAGPQRVRRGQGDDDVLPAQPVVLGHPDHVGRAAAGAWILQKDGEGASLRGAFQAAQIGHGDAAGGERDIGKRRRQGRRPMSWRITRIDRPERRERGKKAARPHRAQRRRDAERLGDAEAIDFVTGLAGGEHPGRRSLRHEPVGDLMFHRPQV